MASLGSCQNRALAAGGPPWKQGNQNRGNSHPGEHDSGVSQDDRRQRTGFKGSMSSCVVKVKPSRSGDEFHVGCWREKELQGFGLKQLAGKWGGWGVTGSSALEVLRLKYRLDIQLKNGANRIEVQTGSRSMGFTQ